MFVMGKFQDLTGMKFNRLTVVSRTENQGYNTTWLCKCDCGNEKIIRGSALKNGTIQSCGCLHREMTGNSRRTHGETGICYKTLQKRIKKGWDLERVFSETPIKTNFIDLKGKCFGRITVISLAHTNHGSHWNCICSCGNKKVIRGYNLINGLTKSCGCLQKEIAFERLRRTKI